jgi:surface protein
VKNCIAKVPSGDSCCSRTDHAECGEAGRIDIPNWDVSQITSFEEIFAYASDFNQDLSRWDTGMATTMYAMFDYAHAFNGDISDWNTTNVVDMKFMFYEARDFDGDISRWNVATATRGDEGHFDQNFADMFYGAVAWQRKYTNCGHSITARNFASVCGNPELNNNSGHSVVYSANKLDGPPNAWILSA